VFAYLTISHPEGEEKWKSLIFEEKSENFFLLLWLMVLTLFPCRLDFSQKNYLLFGSFSSP
jgi:hypothetical protein